MENVTIVITEDLTEVMMESRRNRQGLREKRLHPTALICAHLEGEGESGPFGWGRRPWEAVHDLIHFVEPREW